ncbi:hypothetical protein ACLMJK_003272 [Lecanora helva]
MTLKVIIVGAGIAGLCASVALRSAGLDVEVFEKSAFATEVGAALSVTPNGARALASLGFSFERARACKLETWNSLAGRDLECVRKIDLSASEKTFGAAAWTVHRVDLHSELLHLATNVGSQGSKPVTLRLNAHVVDSDTQGAVVLSDGSKHFADLVIAADGVHSVLRGKVTSNDATPRETGMSAFRFLIDTPVLKRQLHLAKTLERKGPTDAAILIDFEDKIHERHMVWYPCRNLDFGKRIDVRLGQKIAMLDEFGHFDPGVVQTIK